MTSCPHPGYGPVVADTSPAAAPGWYKVAEQTERYWDGAAWTDQTRVIGAAGGPSGKGLGCGCLALVAAVVAIWVVGSLGGDDEDDGGGEYGARDVCEQFVKDRLKSPSSADFSDTQTTGSGDHWTVTGSVDSENSFGAMIRNTYVCEVEHTSGDNWRAVSVDVTSN